MWILLPRNVQALKLGLRNRNMISSSDNFSIIKSSDTNCNLSYQFTTGHKAVLEIIPKHFCSPFHVNI